MALEFRSCNLAEPGMHWAWARPRFCSVKRAPGQADCPSLSFTPLPVTDRWGWKVSGSPSQFCFLKSELGNLSSFIIQGQATGAGLVPPGIKRVAQNRLAANLWGHKSAGTTPPQSWPRVHGLFALALTFMWIQCAPCYTRGSFSVIQGPLLSCCSKFLALFSHQL